MTRSLTSSSGTTATSSTSFERFESDLADELAEKVSLYSNLLLRCSVHTREQPKYGQRLYSYFPATASTLAWESITSLSSNTILSSLRVILDSVFSSFIPHMSEARQGFEYLFEDEPASEILPSNLSKVRVSTEDDIDLPWA